eukprot:scaffold30009_cov51-Attheya_sp.AAC.1
MSYIVSPKESKSFSSFLHARIASANYEHNHDLSTVTQRTKAMKRSGRLTLELKPFQVLLMLLREKNNLDSQTLQPLLLKHLPHYVSIDSSLIRNFRNKAMAYWSRHDACDELTMEEAEKCSKI